MNAFCAKASALQKLARFFQNMFFVETLKIQLVNKILKIPCAFTLLETFCLAETFVSKYLVFNPFMTEAVII